MAQPRDFVILTQLNLKEAKLSRLLSSLLRASVRTAQCVSLTASEACAVQTLLLRKGQNFQYVF